MTGSAIERAKQRQHVAACESACEKAERSAGDLWDALAEVHRLEAWRIRDGGYPSFTAWAQKKLDVSERQSYRYLAKAKAVVELAAATGMSTEEAAVEVPLTPPPAPVPPGAPDTSAHGTRDPRLKIVNWSRMVAVAEKLTTDVAGTTEPPPPSVREALLHAREALDRVLGAP